MDVDLRKLRYFVAVAEELNFGRAAERLHIAQPVLSRQIRALEQELHAQLFTRTTRATELTPAGRQLLEDSGPLLAGAAALRRRVQLAARGRATFTIGFMPGLTVTADARTLADRHPGLSVEVQRTSWTDQIEVVHDGQVDVSVVRLPVPGKGLRLQPLFTEPRVVALPASHRLAGKDTVDISDLAADRLLQDPDAVPEWRDIAIETDDAASPPEVRTVEEKLEYVAAGTGIVFLPLSTAAFYTRPDVTYAAVSDLGPSEVALAWSSARRSALVREFVEIAMTGALSRAPQ
ncbi:MAG TPA: LysR substrate-binding domain-containing protein [Mycobacteriales bacterium]|jgi:DNA-binding transcriptional LysR family regulator|nr:LysR substrate-binding domain-containing protein [Mycobacteriales bacterium]